MTAEYKNKLIDIDVDVPTALARFMGNEKLYEKFLRKFVEDESFFKLYVAVNNKDAESAFSAAHTLKGVAGNLGLDCITKPLLPIVEKLRRGELDGVEEVVRRIELIHEELCSLIKSESGS